MTRTDRLTAILDILAKTGQVEVEEIVSQLAVSPATARRDLDSLAKRRLLTRTRGGATTGALAYDLPGRYNRDDHAEAKEQIAQAASALIRPGAVIGLCGGTTSTALAQILATREDLNAPANQPTLTVVTNAINIASQLAGRPTLTDIIMQKVVLDIAFIGVNGIDPIVGPTNTGEGEASVNALLASRARVSYVLADSSKVGVRAFATMDGYDFTRLITDAGISAEDKAAFEANGTEVIVAPH